MKQEMPKFEDEKQLYEFLVKNDNLFGWYCQIPYGYCFNGTQEYHIYKIVGVLGESNTWCDIPDTGQEPKIHDTMEYVVNVIHCGIEETKVLRFALKDVKPFKIDKKSIAFDLIDTKNVDIKLLKWAYPSVEAYNVKVRTEKDYWWREELIPEEFEFIGKLVGAE